MIIKKLLWTGALLAVGPLLQTSALLEHIDFSATASTQPDLLRTASPDSSPSQTATIRSNTGIQLPNIRDPLPSSLLLPLPPLLLPDLLLPPLKVPSFNSQRLDEELQIYSRYLRLYGTPDVLIIGSSRSLQGIDPVALQEGLAAQGYSGVKVFNFGVNGATAQVISLVLREILNEEQMPKLIIWGDGLRAFNDGRPDETYREIVNSRGYQWLQAGNRPIPVRVFYQDSAVLTASINPSLARSALETSAQRISSVLDMYGFQAVAERFDPTSYFQQYPRVPGEYDADYVPFALGGVQTQATIAAAQHAESHNVPLVVVNLPLTKTYMDAPRLRREQLFRQHMQRLAQEEQFLFRDLVQHPDLIQNQYFADPSHINQDGARAIALQLAADTTIPWSILNQN